MIRLVFTLGRDTISIEVENKVIIYKDKKFPKGFQFMPKDPNLNKLILLSRNRIPQEVIEWINESNSGKNLEEYKNAKDDKELVVIIISDAKKKGLVFQGEINGA